MAQNCTKCKWGILKFNSKYGGLVVGCNCPNYIYNRKMGDMCFTPKEKKHAK